MRTAEEVNAGGGEGLVYGLARFTEGRVTSALVLFGAAPFDVLSFSKVYAPGGPLTLALRPRSRAREIRFLLDTGDSIDEQTLVPRDDGSFFVSRPVPVRPGRYFIEIQGPAPGRATLLFLPIYVGMQEPTAPDDFIQHPPPSPAAPGGWAAWVTAAYNTERMRMGKPPVESSFRLTALAEQRSLLYAAGRRALPTDADAFAAELRSLARGEFFEQVTTAYSTDAVLFRLLQPSVRQRLVRSDRVLLGAGAAPRPTQEDQPPTSTDRRRYGRSSAVRAGPDGSMTGVTLTWGHPRGRRTGSCWSRRRG
jgi:hypothetical protein